MHIEKNVFEQIINTVMNVKDKTKDDLNTRKDMFTHCRHGRLNVCVVQAGKGSHQKVMPKAPYVLRKEQKKGVCESVRKLVPI